MRLNFDCTPGREFRRPFLRRWALLLAFTMGGALVPAHARDGVEVGGNSAFAKLVPAEQVEQSAQLQYSQMLSEAQSKRALAPKDNVELERLRAIAQRIIPFAVDWNPRAASWKWRST